jgi:hypothetical protein
MLAAVMGSHETGKHREVCRQPAPASPIRSCGITAGCALRSGTPEIVAADGGGETIPFRWSEDEGGAGGVLRVPDTDARVHMSDLDALLATRAAAALEPLRTR